MTEILLGFEVDTGERVMLPLHHTVVTGMTQLTGKTTTLEALVHRGKITAIAFLTKRGESGFRGQREIPPYFKEQKRGDLIDWQYVEAILEATMGEKMKFERSWIIDSCKGDPALGTSPAHSLEEVYKNIRKGQEDSRRALDQSIFTNLSAYFEIILPQIRTYKFVERLDLKPGFNVMNLIGMKDEMQQLVIESVVSYILVKLEHIVIVLPEAQKFIPEGKKTPVKGTAVRFIQEGAVLGNYMWFDTQVTTTVDKNLLKQCGNWIMGYQQERNEVASVRENVGKVIKEEQITSLKLGHFMALLEKKVYHVYVLPAGISEEMGRAVALGKMSVEEIRDRMKKIGSVLQEPKLAVDEIRGSIVPEKIDMEPEYRRRISELEEETENLKKRPTIEEFNQALENTKQIMIKARDDEMTKKDREISIRDEELERSRKLMRDFVWPLMQPMVEQLVKTSGFDEAKIRQMVEERIDKKIEEKLQALSPKQRRQIDTGETQIPWVNVWLPRVGRAEQKILRFMASRYPLKMTKAQIAIGSILSVKGGYFNGAFNNLMKWKLLKEEENQFTLAEGPPG